MTRGKEEARCMGELEQATQTYKTNRKIWNRELNCLTNRPVVEASFIHDERALGGKKTYAQKRPLFDCPNTSSYQTQSRREREEREKTIQFLQSSNTDDAIIRDAAVLNTQCGFGRFYHEVKNKRPMQAQVLRSGGTAMQYWHGRGGRSVPVLHHRSTTRNERCWAVKVKRSAFTAIGETF